MDFGGQKGFVRLALRHHVDIVPLLCLGGHDAFYVIRCGERIAKGIGADRWLRSDAWPIFLGLPWGIGFGPLFHVPLPTKVLIEVGEKVDLSTTSPEQAEDDEFVNKIAARVEGALQAMMDQRVRELEQRRASRGIPGRWLPLP